METNRWWIKSFLILTAISIIIALNGILFPKIALSNGLHPMDEKAFLIKIEGAIHSGSSTYQSTGADSILQQLRKVAKKPSIKGILIEINSPGGTVAASQEIYQEILKLRKEKKVVVSMKDLAASGGYYIASAADYIFAEPGTITGSIGVIMMSPNIQGLLQKYSVEMRVFKAGKYKDILSMYRKATAEEKDFLRQLLDDTYNQFIKDVAKGRKLSQEIVRGFAEGKIFSGSQAVQLKMADALGGRKEALKKLTELAKAKKPLQLQEETESPMNDFLRLLKMKLSIGYDFSSQFGFSNRSLPIMVILPSYTGLGL